MLVSASAYKAQEFEEILRPLEYTVKTLFGLKEDIEVEGAGTTSEENALIKTKVIHERLGIKVIMDDSGPAVNALDGASGIYSARLMGRDTPYDIKDQYLIDQHRYAKDRGYQFICTITYAQADGSEYVFIEIIKGIVADHMGGAEGFSYGPIFYYSPCGTTLANMNEGQEDRVSHRGYALAELVAFMEKEK